MKIMKATFFAASLAILASCGVSTRNSGLAAVQTAAASNNPTLAAQSFYTAVGIQVTFQNGLTTQQESQAMNTLAQAESDGSISSSTSNGNAITAITIVPSMGGVSYQNWQYQPNGAGGFAGYIPFDASVSDVESFLSYVLSD